MKQLCNHTKACEALLLLWNVPSGPEYPPLNLRVLSSRLWFLNTPLVSANCTINQLNQFSKEKNELNQVSIKEKENSQLDTFYFVFSSNCIKRHILTISINIYWLPFVFVAYYSLVKHFHKHFPFWLLQLPCKVETSLIFENRKLIRGWQGQNSDHLTFHPVFSVFHTALMIDNLLLLSWALLKLVFKISPLEHVGKG